MVEGSPIVNLVNMALLTAIKDGASDIHIEPYEKQLRVRYRIDGVLEEVMEPPIKLKNAIISRLKIMARLNIAEKRVPQDGRIQVHTQGRAVDLRFSSLPGLFGEKVVLRVLDKNQSLLDVEAFRWTSAGGMVGLGSLTVGDFYSQANGVSGDGLVVVGESESEVV